jgi:hypothetical protein
MGQICNDLGLLYFPAAKLPLTLFFMWLRLPENFFLDELFLGRKILEVLLLQGFFGKIASGW